MMTDFLKEVGTTEVVRDGCKQTSKLIRHGDNMIIAALSAAS